LLHSRSTSQFEDRKDPGFRIHKETRIAGIFVEKNLIGGRATTENNPVPDKIIVFLKQQPNYHNIQPLAACQRNGRREMSSSATTNKNHNKIHGIEKDGHHLHYPFWFGGSASCFAAAVTHPLDLSMIFQLYTRDMHQEIIQS